MQRGESIAVAYTLHHLIPVVDVGRGYGASWHTPKGVRSSSVAPVAPTASSMLLLPSTLPPVCSYSPPLCSYLIPGLLPGWVVRLHRVTESYNHV